VVTISIFFIALPDNLNEILGRAVLTVNSVRNPQAEPVVR